MVSQDMLVLLVWEAIFWTAEEMRRVSFMNENHQDLNSLRIWLIKIYPVGIILHGGNELMRNWENDELPRMTGLSEFDGR